jgi:hypothetical protein
MDEMIDAKSSRLSHRAQRGAIIRSFAQHEGFHIFKNELDSIIQDKKNKWLQGTDEDAKIFRYQAQGIEMALGVLKRMILDGDLAVSQLRENTENSLEPENQSRQAQ